eukprot:6555-Prymnesium_polylepis.1
MGESADEHDLTSPEPKQLQRKNSWRRRLQRKISWERKQSAAAAAGVEPTAPTRTAAAPSTAPTPGDASTAAVAALRIVFRWRTGQR